MPVSKPVRSTSRRRIAVAPPPKPGAQTENIRSFFNLEAPRGALQMLKVFTAERPSRTQRMEMGQALRKTVPRTSLGIYVPPRGRADPVAVLEQQNSTRIKKLVPIRYARMLVSPFSFLRGAAAIMAADLAGSPTTGINVAACGDMHVANFGLCASAERQLIFSINDFDEIYPGPWEWDLKRTAASAAVAARFMGGSLADARKSVIAAVRSYRNHMRRYSELGFLEVWYDRIDERAILDSVPPRLRQAAEDAMAKARVKGNIRVLGKLTEFVNGERRLAEDAPLIVRETHTADGGSISAALDQMLLDYCASLPEDRRRVLSRYRIVDVARKVVGVGSVGTGCWVVFLQGRDSDDPLFLQVKEARQSVLAPYVKTPFVMKNQGQRVVVGQRLTQGSPDIFLGWGGSEGKNFYVRQLADMKGGIHFEADDKSQMNGFPAYCELCGWALALAHAKSGDAAMIAGYCGKSDALDQSMVSFALSYLEQTEADHDALVRADRSGRIKVPKGLPI